MTSTTARELSKKDQLSIRSDGEVKLALDMVVARLRSRGKVRFKGLRVTQEAIVNASFLMLADMDDAELEETMGRYVRELEDLLRGDDVAETQHGDRAEAISAAKDQTEAPIRELTLESDRVAQRRDIPPPKRPTAKKVVPKGKGDK